MLSIHCDSLWQCTHYRVQWYNGTVVICLMYSDTCGGGVSTRLITIMSNSYCKPWIALWYIWRKPPGTYAQLGSQKCHFSISSCHTVRPISQQYLFSAGSGCLKANTLWLLDCASKA